MGKFRGQHTFLAFASAVAPVSAFAALGHALQKGRIILCTEEGLLTTISPLDDVMGNPSAAARAILGMPEFYHLET